MIDKEVDYHLICGDFNTTPDSEEFTLFTQLTGAIDCYTAGGGNEPRTSFPHPPIRSIDHILAVPVLNKHPFPPQFINSSIVLNTPDAENGLYPSDHFGVITTLITNPSII